jgi:hypothetical protein
MPDVTLSAAIKEAYASSNVIIYHTLELNHPTFTEPIRVVRDRANLVSSLEDTAPRNPGEQVTFIAFAFDFTKPEVNPQGVPQMTITMDNVGQELTSALEYSLESTASITAIYREYIASDLTGPQNDPPITMTIMSITANQYQVTATAGFPDLMNKRFPTKEYSAEDFPGLIA